MNKMDDYLTMEQLEAMLGRENAAKMIEELPDDRIATNVVEDDAPMSQGEAALRSAMYLAGIYKLEEEN